MRSAQSVGGRSLVAVLLIMAAMAPAVSAATLRLRPLITDAAEQQAPAIYEQRIVWQDQRNGQWDIFLYDLSTQQEQPLTTAAGDQVAPAIWDDRVVWADQSSVAVEFVLHDLTTGQEQRISPLAPAVAAPAIWGDRIVWISADRNHDLWSYDISTGVQQRLNGPSYDDRRPPVLWRDRLIHNDFLNGPFTWYLFEYNFATGLDRFVLFSSDTKKQEWPAIWEDRLVAQEYETPDAHANIVLYDLATDERRQITADDADQFTPAIWGDRIVWEDQRNGNADIFLYDLATNTEQPVVTDPATQRHPKISEHAIVWEDTRSGNTDLYLAEIEPTTAAPRHQLATGTEVYQFVNFAWGKTFDAAQSRFLYTYGMDFGFSPLQDARRIVDNPQIAADLDALRDAGVEGIRWFVIPDGRNLTFDAARTPTGRGAGFTEDLDRALDLLSDRQMSVILTLLDGNTWFKPEGEFQGALFGHAGTIIDATKRQALYDTVIIPILEDIAAWQQAHPEVPSPVAAIDLGNELENGVDGLQHTGVSLFHMQTYVREAAALVHQHLPGIPVTVGAARASGVVNVWSDEALGVAAGEGLDFYSFHHYGSEPLQGPNGLRARFGLDQLDKRIYLQEFPGKNAPLGSVEMYLAPIGGTRGGRTGEGWLAGSYLWSLNGNDDGATPDDPIAALQQITAWFTKAFDRPDLTITNLIVPDPIMEGDPTQFDFTIVNHGGVSAPTSRFELWLNGVQLAGLMLQPLEPGDTQFVTVPDPPWTALGGRHNLWSKVDVWLQVDEADETNNERTAQIEVTPALRPDLVVSAVAPTAPYVVGGLTQWSVTVINQGLEGAAPSQFEVWLDGVQLDTTSVEALQAGQSTTFIVPSTPWIATAGDHVLWSKADVLLQVAESNEANNERTVAFALAAADVTVITGQVTNAQTAAAVPEASVQVRLGPGRRRIAHTRTNASGTYQLPPIANGTYLLRVVKNGYNTVRVPLTVQGLPVTLDVGLVKRK